MFTLLLKLLLAILLLYWHCQICLTAEVFNCSRREAIIVNVCLFYAKFSLDRFEFSSDFYAFDFLRFA